MAQEPGRAGRAMGSSLLRFSRADGTATTLFGSKEDASRARANLLTFAGIYPRTGEARVIGWWLAAGSASCRTPVAGVVEPGASPRGLARRLAKNDDLLCLDQRNGESSTAFELIGSGVSWLGPDWRLAGATGSAARARPVCWVSNSQVDLAEWSFRAVGLRLTRTTVLLRGLRMAILGDQIEGRPWSRHPCDAVCPTSRRSGGADCRESGASCSGRPQPVVGSGPSRSRCPALPYETDRGHFRDSEGRPRVEREPARPALLAPLVVSWDAQRNRKRLSWRVLTVSEDSGLPSRRRLRRPHELGTR